MLYAGASGLIKRRNVRVVAPLSPPHIAAHAVTNCLAVLQQVIAEVQAYHEQARLIVAGRLLAAVDRYLESGHHAGRAEVKAALALLRGELKPTFDELRQRAAECASTLDDWHSVSARYV